MEVLLLKIRKIVIIGIFILLGLTVFVYKPEIKTYTIPKPERGFILGARTESSFIFPFYNHPTEDKVPLRQFETLYANKLIVYALGYGESGEEVLKVRMYRLEMIETGNGTKEQIFDEMEFDFILSATKFKVVENSLELPRHDQEYKIEIYSQSGRRVFVFSHLTHPVYLPAEQHTQGSLFLDRLVYILSALLLSLMGLALARFTVDRKKVVPQVGTGTALWFMTMSGIMIYFSATILIYTFGIIDLWWTYLPLLFSSYLFGFSIIKPNTVNLYFMKTLESNIPLKELDSIKAVKRQNQLYNALISWKDFIIGKEQKIDFGESYYWYWHIKNSDDRIYIHKSITKEEMIKVELGGIHFKDVDKFLSELKTVESISEQKEIFRKELLNLLAKFEVVVDKRALEFTKKYMELMMMEDVETQPQEETSEG